MWIYWFIGAIVLIAGIGTLVLDRLWALEDAKDAKAKEATKADRKPTRKSHDELVDGKPSYQIEDPLKGVSNLAPNRSLEGTPTPLGASQGIPDTFEIPGDVDLAEFSIR